MTYKPAANRPIPEVSSVQGTDKEMVNTSLLSQIPNKYNVPCKGQEESNKARCCIYLCNIACTMSFTRGRGITMALSPLSL